MSVALTAIQIVAPAVYQGAMVAEVASPSVLPNASKKKLDSRTDEHFVAAACHSL
jgi:hypothetical protein